jgi:threonine dehydratase
VNAPGSAVDIAAVRDAADAIRSFVFTTPFAPSRTLSELSGASVFVKFENLQFTGSFKDRGAANRLLALDAEQRRRGVIAMSAGNHAQGVAAFAHALGIPATIVMPENTPFVKRARTAELGAQVTLAGATVEDAARVAHTRAEAEGLTLIHPYDDPLVIAGQGTVGLEMLTSIPDLDAIVAPVGGGGLMGGVAVAVRALAPTIELIGVQTEVFSAVAAHFHPEVAGRIPSEPGTIADGIAVPQPGSITLPLLRALVDDVVTVPEPAIETAITRYLEIEKTIAEGAGAAPLALLFHDPGRFAGKRVGLVLSGGNIDPRVLSSVILRGLARQGRLVRYRVEADDSPGQLARIATVVGDADANIVDVEHSRLDPAIGPRRSVVELLLETLDDDHADRVEAILRSEGFRVERVPA